MRPLQTDDIYDDRDSKPSKNQRQRMNRKRRELTEEQSTVMRFYKNYFNNMEANKPELRPLVFNKAIIHNGKRELPNEKIVGLLDEAYFEDNKIVISEINIEFIPIEQWVAVTDYLHSRSFDVYGLIDKGLAVEKND